jgi:hypothetical protein
MNVTQIRRAYVVDAALAAGALIAWPAWVPDRLVTD